MPADSHDSVVVALDQGGQSSRAVVFDQRGRRLASAQIAVRSRRPSPNFVEYDAEELLTTLRVALGSALTNIESSSVHSIGLATQRSTLVAWDRRSLAPLCAALSWQDTRGQSLLDEMERNAERITEITGLPLSAHYGASKFRWIWDNVPAIRQAERRGHLAWGPISSYLVARVTKEGVARVDPANGARTMVWDAARGDWSSELLQLFGLPASPWPATAKTLDNFGTVALAGSTAPLRVVTGDQSAVPFASGWPQPDDVFINLGTGAFIQKILDGTASAEPGAGYATSAVYVADESVRAVEAAVNGAGDALNWIARRLGLQPDEALGLARTPTGTDPLFINGVSGLGSPYWSTGLSSEFIGVGDPSAQVSAVLESIAFLIQLNLERWPTVTTQVQLTGGLSRSDLLAQQIANLCDCRVLRPRMFEATASGVAYLLVQPGSCWQGRGLVDCFEAAGGDATRERYARWKRQLEARL